MHLKQHVEQTHTEASYECDKCFKRFKQNRMLKQHVTTIHGDRKITCKVCNKELLSSSSMWRHMKRHNQQVFKCESCPETYAKNESLKRHKKVHSETQTTLPTKKSKQTRGSNNIVSIKKDHICKICGKGFHTVTQLKKHSDVHTTLMHYFCQYCSRGFKQGGTLKRHEQRCLKSKEQRENQPLD